MQVHVRAPLQRGTRNGDERFSAPRLPHSAFACWSWCKSSIPPCDGGSAGASPAGQPNFNRAALRAPRSTKLNPLTRRPAQPWRPYGKPTAHPRRRTVFSRPPANAGRASLPRRRSGVASASSTATKSCAGSWAGTTSARAARTTAFRNCCLRAGRFDGSRRNHYFRE